MSPISNQRAKQLILLMILAGQLMIVLDVSVVTTALPSIERTLGFSPSSLTWVQNAYTLTFGGLLLLGARAGDILGRRRVFVAGIALFTAASFAGGIAQSSEWLLIARAIQGVAAAVAAPSTLALLQQTFQEPRERTRAIAMFSSVVGAGASLGLVIGGLLTDLVSWRYALFINVPIGIALVVLVPRFVPESERHTGHFDLVGAITSTLGMASIVYGFVRAASDGWTNTGTVASFVGGVALMVWFVFNELHAEQPITPLHLFASRERTGANVARLLLVGGIFSMFFFVTQYTQGVLHFNPIEAGLAFLPQTVILFAMVQVIPRISGRVNPATIVAIGVSIALVGMLWLSRIGDHASYFPSIALPLVLLGIGMGSAFISLTTLGIAGVEPWDAGAASGLVNMAQQMGGTLGLAILVTVYQSSSRDIANPTDALAHGVSAVLTGSAVFMAAALAIILLVVRKPSEKAEVIQAFEAPAEMAS
jgi:EmrB/QacA subfamily drug resistance transporter